MWTLIVLATIVSMPVAARMAEARGRAGKTWLWISAAIGPLALLWLYWLGASGGTKSSN